MSDLANRKYTPYSDSLEQVPADEPEYIKKVCEQINIIQQANFDGHRYDTNRNRVLADATGTALGVLMQRHMDWW